MQYYQTEEQSLLINNSFFLSFDISIDELTPVNAEQLLSALLDTQN
jgi:hypothetical protein